MSTPEIDLTLNKKETMRKILAEIKTNLSGIHIITHRGTLDQSLTDLLTQLNTLSDNETDTLYVGFQMMLAEFADDLCIISVDADSLRIRPDE